jgi:hypothetical protein
VVHGADGLVDVQELLVRHFHGLMYTRTRTAGVAGAAALPVVVAGSVAAAAAVGYVQDGGRQGLELLAAAAGPSSFSTCPKNSADEKGCTVSPSSAGIYTTEKSVCKIKKVEKCTRGRERDQVSLQISVSLVYTERDARGRYLPASGCLMSVAAAQCVDQDKSVDYTSGFSPCHFLSVQEDTTTTTLQTH